MLAATQALAMGTLAAGFPNEALQLLNLKMSVSTAGGHNGGVSAHRVFLIIDIILGSEAAAPLSRLPLVQLIGLSLGVPRRCVKRGVSSMKTSWRPSGGGACVLRTCAAGAGHLQPPRTTRRDGC